MSLKGARIVSKLLEQMETARQKLEPLAFPTKGIPGQPSTKQDLEILNLVREAEIKLEDALQPVITRDFPPQLGWPTPPSSPPAS